MRKAVRWYVWKERLFTAAGIPDCEWKILGRTVAEHTGVNAMIAFAMQYGLLTRRCR